VHRRARISSGLVGGNSSSLSEQEVRASCAVMVMEKKSRAKESEAAKEQSV
jgi:hypothetical protein